MLGIGKNSRGSIPVTIFVIVVLVLLIVTLGAFSIGTYNDRGTIEDGFRQVQEYNSKVAEAKYNGQEFVDAIRLDEKKYWIAGEKIQKVSVSRIP